MERLEQLELLEPTLFHGFQSFQQFQMFQQFKIHYSFKSSFMIRQQLYPDPAITASAGCIAAPT